MPERPGQPCLTAAARPMAETWPQPARAGASAAAGWTDLSTGINPHPGPGLGPCPVEAGPAAGRVMESPAAGICGSPARLTAVPRASAYGAPRPGPCSRSFPGHRCGSVWLPRLVPGRAAGPVSSAPILMAAMAPAWRLAGHAGVEPLDGPRVRQPDPGKTLPETVDRHPSQQPGTGPGCRTPTKGPAGPCPTRRATRWAPRGRRGGRGCRSRAFPSPEVRRAVRE